MLYVGTFEVLYRTTVGHQIHILLVMRCQCQIQTIKTDSFGDDSTCAAVLQNPGAELIVSGNIIVETLLTLLSVGLVDGDVNPTCALTSAPANAGVVLLMGSSLCMMALRSPDPVPF